MDEPTDRLSQYTSVADCPIVRASPEEAGFKVTVCEGIPDYRLQRTEADARDNLAVIAADGREHDLDLPMLFGGTFSTLGDRIEWRGTSAGGSFRPDAMILRYDVFAPDSPDRPTPYLLVVSLAGTPCVTARLAPGDAQNERARQAADRPSECMRT